MIARKMKALLALTLIFCCAWTVGAQPLAPSVDAIGEIPGARIVFHETKDPIAPAKGHSLAQLDFEANDLQSYGKKYQDAGGKLDSAVTTSAAANLSIIRFTDPWGTSIEVSQGLAAVK